ncbi:MAG: hypothetical protein L6V95_12175 [Candidatus Melainabacteria bacterium]|nr:MAG: hypothetical protein L6V95_12175 [Candidatus Melainabacteria bacterium]
MGKASNSNLIKVLALFAIIASYAIPQPHSIVNAANGQINGGLNSTSKDYYESGKK